MAAEIREAFGVESELIEGSGGVFEVKADGVLIYSKAETGGFPAPGEAVRRLSARA